MERDMQALKDTVETWGEQRKKGREFYRRDLGKFVEQHNFHTRKLISLMQSQDPEFYSALCELAQNACTLVTKGAKIFADGIDRTNS